MAENIVLKVNGMSCEHCAKTIRRAINVFEGYEKSNVDVDAGTVEIEFDAPATKSGFIAAIENAGYSVEQ